MRAIHLTEFGDLGQIRTSEIPKPAAEPGKAIVRVHAAGINPSDLKNIQGAMKHLTKLPRTPGRDYAGTVAEGPEEWLYKEVWGVGGDLGFTVDGSYAEYLSVPVGSLREKPRNLDMVSAAAAGVPYLTAYKGLIEICEAKGDETVLVVGASGSVGTAVSQIARWKGLEVIGTAKDPRDIPSERMKVVNLESEELSERVRALTDAKGVDVCFNAVGGSTFEPALMSLAIHGRMVCIAAVGEQTVPLNLFYFYRHQLKLYGLDTLQLDSTQCAEVLEKLTPGFETGKLRVASPEAVPLDEAADAFDKIVHGERGKKVLVL